MQHTYQGFVLKLEKRSPYGQLTVSVCLSVRPSSRLSVCQHQSIFESFDLQESGIPYESNSVVLYKHSENSKMVYFIQNQLSRVSLISYKLFQLSVAVKSMTKEFQKYAQLSTDLLLISFYFQLTKRSFKPIFPHIHTSST